MTVDQDLSGDMVKVVQYTIVSIATDIIDDARVIQDPKTVAFADDMTAADFTAWRLSVDRHDINKCIEEKCRKREWRSFKSILQNPKWYRVAFHVISRFAPVDIDWAESQARSMQLIANHLRPPIGMAVAPQQFDYNVDGREGSVEVTKPDPGPIPPGNDQS